MKARRAWLWPGFFLFAACLLAAMAWTTRVVLNLERAETRARRDARFQSSLRLALWRLDSKGSLFLAREAARPHTEYAPFYFVQGDVYTKELAQVQQGELLQPSPLLLNRPPEVRVYFQFDQNGRFTSPQFPAGNFLDLAGSKYSADIDDQTLAAVERVRDGLDLEELRGELERAELASRRAQNRDRQEAAWQAKRGTRAPQPPRGVEIGSLEAIWARGELFCLRRVRVGGDHLIQGFLLDWQALRDGLLQETHDLLPDARLVPGSDPERGMATLPFVLDAPRPAAPSRMRWTASHTALAFTWPVVLLAIVSAGFALRRAIAFGEKQRRFASLVTHELRSPLTTFRLYADLLAEGMVKDAEKQDTYHKALQRESDQMARMVENVIAHSRLEQGRAKMRLERVVLSGLLRDLAPELTARAARAGLSLTIDADGLDAIAVDVDTEAVAQILINLVENACKYGRSQERPSILIGAQVRDGAVRLRVRDHGPGVPPAIARRIFFPFDRGDRDETDPTRGLGIGLALGRGLARDLGGDLTLEIPPDGGACFVLSLPCPGPDG